VTQSDPEGDAEFSRNPLPAFDLKSVSFEAFADHHLLVTYTGYGPMSELGKTYSWFAAWIDLDNNGQTGDSYGDLGADLILRTESSRGGGQWTGEANTRAPVGMSAPITLLKSWTEGDQAFTFYQSSLFATYPMFRAVAFAHHKGEFVDHIKGGSLNDIVLFNRPELLKPAPDFHDYSFEGEGELRMWNDRTGSFSIEASLQEARSKEVVLLLPTGETRTVEVVRLSAPDKDYLLERQKAPAPRVVSTPLATESRFSDRQQVPGVMQVEETSEENLDFSWEGFSAEMLSYDGFGGDELFLKVIRIVAGINPDSLKPAWAFPVALITGGLINLIGGLWFLVRTFSESKEKGFLLILLNVLSTFFLPLELLRICFLFGIAFSDWSFFYKPLFLHLLGIGLVFASFLLVQQSIIPAQ